MDGVLAGPWSGAKPYQFGKYTLLVKLAQGGMGEIFAALLTGEAGFEKRVVIKRILPHLAEDPRFVSMFLTEARVTASLTHPNICQVFELGQIDGEYYLAMEYLEGVSLARLIRMNTNRGLDLRLTAAILCQALEGLEFAHCFRTPDRGMAGIIHRDMSPSNVFVTSAGLVKVLDFGVAKVSHHAVNTATGLKGKYPYMSPEQIRGLEVDGRADLFAIGVLLYETVTGRSLFQRESDFETLLAVIQDPRPPASQARADIPPQLEEVIDRSLRVVREERFASAREMSEALARAMEPVGGMAKRREVAELVRRDCATDLAVQRERIHNAMAHLASMSEQGLEPPPFIDRRPRPIVAHPPEPTVLMEPGAAAPSGRGVARSPTVSALTTGPCSSAHAEVAPLSGARSGRQKLVAVLLILAAIGVGATGSWLRGSAEGLPQVAFGKASSIAGEAVPASAPGNAWPMAGETVPLPIHDPGFFSVDALPHANIYIDGNPAGVTPVVRVPLTPGKHSIRAVTESGIETTFDIVIRPGETLTRRLSLNSLPP